MSRRRIPPPVQIAQAVLELPHAETHAIAVDTVQRMIKDRFRTQLKFAAQWLDNAVNGDDRLHLARAHDDGFLTFDPPLEGALGAANYGYVRIMPDGAFRAPEVPAPPILVSEDALFVVTSPAVRHLMQRAEHARLAVLPRPVTETATRTRRPTARAAPTDQRPDPCRTFQVAMSGRDFDYLCQERLAWRNHIEPWSDHDDRFSSLDDRPVSYDWLMAYWLLDWTTLLLARAFLDSEHDGYQVVHDNAAGGGFVLLTNYVSPGRGKPQTMLKGR